MPRKVTIPLLDGDDMERLADLRREVDIAERFTERARLSAEEPGSTARAGDDLSSDAVAKAEARVQVAQDTYDAFVDEASERAEEWVLTTIGHEEFRTLLREHPPRKVPAEDGNGETTHPDDAGWEVNAETFPKALLTFVDPEDDEIRTVQAPFESPAALRKRIKRLSAGEFDTIWVAAYSLNNGGVADPKASRFSPDVPRSDET